MVELTAEQRDAESRILDFVDADKVDKPYLTMHGLAGVGKTEVLTSVARKRAGGLLCALYGRAAYNLQRKTGLPSDTIHSIFYKLREHVRSSDGRERMKFDAVHEAGELEGTTLLLDESSVVPAEVANDLLRTGVRIVACGDPGQLQPVNGEQFFTKPDITLRQVHRQALDSPIIRQAHWVRLGRGYRADGDDFQVVDRLDPGAAVAADIILCWKNATRKTVNMLMRRMKGITALNPQPGERILCLKNARDYGLYNGASCELAREFHDGDSVIHVLVDGMEERIENVRFEGFQDTVPRWQDVTTSFAFDQCRTTHKMQGSEEDNIILIDEYTRQDERVSWLYTGITRAAKRMTIVRRC